MDRELKSCPMCGSKAELKESYYLESEQPYSYVHCLNDGCALNHNAAHFSGSSKTKNSEKAVDAWNKREQIPELHH
jgi:hypothetical protein